MSDISETQVVRRCLDLNPLPMIDPAMTNFDHTVDADLAEGLAGGETMADYAGWNFHGLVYSPEPGVFVADIHRYGVHVDFVEASTPEDLMEAVSDRWGWE